MVRDDLGNRMKGYENVERRYLMRRVPMLIRLDGKAFHSFTKGFQRPFDMVLRKSMWETAIYLCENIMGCKLAYTQSDEIQLLITDYDKITSEAWFDKNILKMTSISASMATLAFNKSFSKNVKEFIVNQHIKYPDGLPADVEKLIETYKRKENTALFDSRVFNIPKEEVCNAFIWRQQDATRNAIQLVGQSYFSHKTLHGKKCSQIQEMLFTERGINFNDYPVYHKRGVCIVKETIQRNDVDRTVWVVDENIPIFTQDRDYINRYL